MNTIDDSRSNPKYDPELALRLEAAKAGAFGYDIDPDPAWLALVVPADEKGRRLSIQEILDRAGDLAAGISVPQEFDQSLLRQSADQYLVFMRSSVLEALNAAQDALDVGIERITIGAPLRVRSGACPPYVPPVPGSIDLAADDVVMVVIDNGMGIGHDLFRRRSGTTGDDRLVESRVDFFLNMEGYRAATLNEAGDVIEPACLGQLFHRAEINALLDAHVGATGLLDEAAFYRDLGLIDWATSVRSTTAQRVSHGTHVMGLAAGYPPDDPVGAKRRIIAVQLPTDEIQSILGREIKPAVAAAFEVIRECYGAYIVDNSSGRSPPVVATFSFGDFSGPHDRHGRFAKMLDNKLKGLGVENVPPKLLVLPSGNGNLARCHAKMTIPGDGDETRIQCRVQPEDRTWSWVDTWLPAGTDDVRMTVTSPDGATAQVTGSDMPLRVPMTNGSGVIAALHYRPADAAIPYRKFILTVRETFRPGAGPVAPSGRWALSFARGAEGTEIPADLWVRRDETLPGFTPLGRQSYFDDPGYERFQQPSGRILPYDPVGTTAMVRRAGTISGMATGQLPAVTAGYLRSRRGFGGGDSLSDYSAAGPTGPGNSYSQGVDIAAMSDDSPALPGVLSAGSSSGSMVAMSGTSVAAPQTARWAADQIAAQSGASPFGRMEVRAAGAPATTPPDARLGGGLLPAGTVFGRNR